MDKSQKWYYENTAKHAVDALGKKKFDAVYANNIDEARSKIFEMLKEGDSIGVGGSVTLNQLDILDELRTPKYKFIERYIQPNFDAMLEKYKEALTADVFISSANAITKNGEIVNLDCTGNRVGALGFGPAKVILICGANKVVENIDEALARCKHIAPVNAKRINHPTPCTADGICHDCAVQARVCNITTIIHNCYKFPGRISVIMVGEELGY